MVNGKRSAEIWSGSSSSLTEKQAKAIIVPVRSGNYLALTGSMAALTFVVVAHESLKWMVWTLGPSEAALCHPGGFDLPLAVEGTVPKKIWNTNPFLSPCPKGKKDAWWICTRSAYTEKRDSSLMDRVSWCKSGITRSGNMITQRMIGGIIPEVLSLVVQLA